MDQKKYIFTINSLLKFPILINDQKYKQYKHAKYESKIVMRRKYYHPNLHIKYAIHELSKSI